MSKTNVANTGRDAKGSKRTASPRSVAGPAGHSFVAFLGLVTSDTAALRELIRRGLTYRSWDRFVESTGLPREMVIQVVQITPRTLARRKDEGRLRPDESDRLVRAARVFSLAVGLFDGDLEAARRWLNHPLPALGGSTPWDYAATEIGAREVENLIGGLEYGIPS
jgi:putative toxin-antitoxin system antitoxin component (TIGR02293 family)